jgi:hypothetical protein
MKSLSVFALIAIVLTGCATGAPISGNPAQDAFANRPVKLSGALSIEDGLKEMAFNLDSAITVQAIPADDPLSACVKGIMKDLGIGDVKDVAPSFVPKEDTLLGRGSVLYIRAQQAQRMAGAGTKLPISCEASIGKIVIDVARANAKSMPGGGLLPALR